MIFESTEKILMTAILEYDKLAGKEFLIGYTIGKNHPIEYIILRINKHNFWHLLGCQVDKSKSEFIKTIDLYEMCKNQQKIREYLVYTKDHKSCVEKSRTFLEIFNFVEKARQIRISSTSNIPDYYKFILIHGNSYGIIGYDHDKMEKNKKILVPKTTQSKSIGSFQNENKKISLILSRKIRSDVFTTLEYEAVSGLYHQISSDIPQDYKIKDIIKTDSHDDMENVAEEEKNEK